MRPPEEVTARWKELARLSDLATGRRLATKVAMSPHAVSRRLRQVEELRRVCVAFARRPREGAGAARDVVSGSRTGSSERSS